MISLFAHIENYFDSTTINTILMKTVSIYNNVTLIKYSINLLASVQDITSQFATSSRLAHNSTIISLFILYHPL